MTLQRIIEEIENIMDQASSDDDIGKDSILEALTDVVRDAKGTDSLDFNMEDDDHYGSWQETDFSSLSDLEN